MIFLGEAFLLSGIAFLLGTVLAGLREGGGEVQHSLGLPVTTLEMPATAKAFVVLMMLGMMLAIAQFIGYLVAIGFSDDTASFSTWLNVLGPLRELSLGLILAGVVLALVSIANVPQRVGRRLWLPMFVMALMGWTVGIILAIAEAATESSASSAVAAERSRRPLAPRCRPSRCPAPQKRCSAS